jgi:hypothetical protein
LLYGACLFDLDDSTLNEFDLLKMTWMQNNGMLDRQNPGPIGELIKGFRNKMTAFKTYFETPTSSSVGPMQWGDWTFDFWALFKPFKDLVRVHS